MSREENALFDFMSSFPGSAAEAFRAEYVRLRNLSTERALLIEDIMPATEDAAREAACEFAAERDEGDGTQDAEDYLAAQIAERAGAPCEDGEWCVWWSTVLDGESRVDARYATKEQADAACEIANEALHAANPGGNLLCGCGYEVRTLLQGRWIRVEDEE